VQVVEEEDQSMSFKVFICFRAANAGRAGEIS